MKWFITLLIGILMLSSVYAIGGLWDRPTYVFNETQFNITYNLSNYYTKTQSNSLYLPLTENTSIYQAITNEINNRIGNDSELLDIINGLPVYDDSSLWNYVYQLNDNINNETQYRINNDSYLQNQINNKLINITSSNNYIIITGNTSQNIFFNESLLNNTINSIAKNEVITKNYTLTSDAVLTDTTILNYLLTSIKVLPQTITNTYHFKLTEYPNTNNTIDRDVMQHIGIWNIQKNYAINSGVQISVLNSSINENFTIQLTYINNGVTQ